MTVSQKNMLLNELFYLCSGSYLLKKMLDTLPRPLTKIIFMLRPTAVEYAGFAPNPFGPHEIFFAGDYQITNVNILHEFVHYLLFELYPNFSSTHSSDVEEYQVKVLVDLLLCRSYGKVVYIQDAVEGDVLTPRYKTGYMILPCMEVVMRNLSNYLLFMVDVLCCIVMTRMIVMIRFIGRRE